jgi:cobalamin-dependent methionine synthase I
MEEREFSMTATVTKVYEVEVRVMATSDENARAQFQELRSEIANGVEEDQLVECMVEEEGCYDPISSLDD